MEFHGTGARTQDHITDLDFTLPCITQELGQTYATQPAISEKLLPPMNKTTNSARPATDWSASCTAA
jgi:hypothetical protein